MVQEMVMSSFFRKAREVLGMTAENEAVSRKLITLPRGPVARRTEGQCTMGGVFSSSHLPWSGHLMLCFEICRLGGKLI